LVAFRLRGNAIVGIALFIAFQLLFLSRIDQSLPGSDPDSVVDHNNALVFIAIDDVASTDVMSQLQCALLPFATLVKPCGQLSVSKIALGHESDSVSTFRHLLDVFERGNGSISCELTRARSSWTRSSNEFRCLGSRGCEKYPVRASTCKTEDTWIPGVIAKVYAWSELANDICP
jgi:hypothetical protein